MNKASRIIESLDESTSPCDDFYQFTCGKWIQSTPIPDHKSSVNAFNQLQDRIYYKIKGNIDITRQRE